MKDKEIYVLMEGGYEPYIVGIFSTREKAKQYQEQYNFGYSHDASINVWKLDGIIDSEPIYQYYVIGIKMVSGEVVHTSKTVEHTKYPEYMEYEKYEELLDGKGELYREYYLLNIDDMSVTKAIDITVEKRQRWLDDNL